MRKNITKVLLRSILTVFIFAISIQFSLAENLERINTNSFMTVIKLSQDLENEMYSNYKVAKTQSSTNRIDFTINKNILFNSFLGKSSVYLENFPIGNGKYGNLRLYYSAPVMNNRTNATVLYKGKAINYKMPEILNYSGTIDGDLESDVFLNVSENGIDGIIQTGYGNIYNVGENVVLSNKVEGLHTLMPTTFEESMHINGVTKYCGVSDEQNYNSFEQRIIDENEIPKIDKHGNLMATSILECNLAIESDYVYFFMFKKKQNDVTLEDEADNEQAIVAGLNYINRVVSMGSRIYNREVNVTFRVDTIIFNADPSYDGYYDIRRNDLSDKLNRMPQVWSNRGNINRSLVTLFSNVRSQPANATVLGIAMSGEPYTGVLCTTDRGYSAVGVNGNGVYPTFNYSQDLQVFVHEVGHNFSSPHTHNCHYQPNLDTCVTQATEPDLAKDACQPNGKKPKLDGDIMSYCHIGGSIIYKFHPEVKKRIRGAADKKRNSCMPIPANPTLQITYPLGSETVFANTDIEIGWNAEKVERINISYSIDGGAKWEQIIGLKRASDSTHTWRVPDVVSTNALIKIEDSNTPSRFDQSILPFRIVQKNVRITSPTNGQKVGYLVPFNVQWTKSQVNQVKIQISTNNGANWIDVSSNLAGLNQLIDFPDVANSTFRIRAVDADEPGVFNEVTVDLGKENVEIDSPKSGHFVCTPNPNFTYYYKTDYVNQMNIWFSNDDKQKWTKVTFQPISGNTWMHAWTGTSNTNNLIVTDKAYVKFTPFGNDNITIGEEGPFTVYECPLSVQDGIFDNSKLRITEISPNPASEKSVMKYYLESKMSNSSMNLEIFDITGNMLMNSDIRQFNSGENTLDLNLAELSQGTYFVVISYGDFKSMEIIKIAK